MGSGNVFLGYEAGYNETGSNTLYIANSDTSSPLIYGDFGTGEVTINGNLTVTWTVTSESSTSGGTDEHQHDEYRDQLRTHRRQHDQHYGPSGGDSGQSGDAWGTHDADCR